MKYKIKLADLEKCVKFAVKYHLDETKGSSNRTTGQYRGLGGIFDNFIIGKIIEIGVSKIIESFSKKRCILDFKIHSLNENNRYDPDIIKIKEKQIKRDPKVYVEIKNISPEDRWIGLTIEQYNTIMKNKIVHDPSKVFLIYAHLESENDSKNSDPLGVFLRKKLKVNLFNDFCNTTDLFVKIDYIISAKELMQKGVKFLQGSFLYETEIFKETNPITAKRVITAKKPFRKKSINKKEIPIIMRNNYRKPREFGKFYFKGKIEAYTKNNDKSKRLYIKAVKDTTVKNKVLGKFKLKKGKVYETFFCTVGLNPSLKRNNIWIAQRNLSNVTNEPTKDKIKKIAKTI